MTTSIQYVFLVNRIRKIKNKITKLKKDQHKKNCNQEKEISILNKELTNLEKDYREVFQKLFETLAGMDTFISYKL